MCRQVANQIARFKIISKIFDSLEAENSDDLIPVKIGYRQLRMLHSLYVHEYKISPIKSKEAETIQSIIDEYTLELDSQFDPDISALTDELSVYNTQSFDTSNSKLNLTSEEEAGKNSDSEIDTERPSDSSGRVESKKNLASTNSNIFLDTVVTPVFPILFSSYCAGPLPDQSPFNSILSFTPFKKSKLSLVLEDVLKHYEDNERSLLICDDFSSLAFVDCFGGNPACLVEIKSEIWY